MNTIKIEEIFFGMHVMHCGVPSVVMGMCGDLSRNGVVFLGEECAKANLSDISPMPIDESSLKHFGFTTDDGKVWKKRVCDDVTIIVKIRVLYGRSECWRVSFGGGLVTGWNEDIRSVHELQRWFNDKVTFHYGITLELEWRDNGKGEV